MVKYVSEFDQWLKKYKQQNPETEQQQREGRALLWEKRSDQIKATVTNKQQGYVYYPVNDYTNK
jgi:hypothetical protein